MVYRNSEKNAAYTTYHGDISELAELVTDYCYSEYGEACEFYKVCIERTHKGSTWTVHEFDSFDDRAVNAVNNHLKARHDVVKLKFGSGDRGDALKFLICYPNNTEVLARYIDNDELDTFDDDSLVVLGVENVEGLEEQQLELLERVESIEK